MSLIESGSSIQKFLNCPKSYEYGVKKGLRSANYSSAAGFGSFFHAYVEEFTKIGRQDAMEKTLVEYLQKHRSQDDQIKIAADFALAKRHGAIWSSVWGYPAHPQSNQQYEWMYSENEWKYPVPETDFIHVGKSDGVIFHDKYQVSFLYELKTAADRNRETYLHGKQLDKQISSNMLALRAQGINVQGVIYDIVWKPGIKRLVGRKTKPDETADEFNERILATIAAQPLNYFTRVIVYRSDKDLENYLVDLRQQFQAIEFAEKNNAYYRNSGACDRFGRMCEFFSMCVEDKPELEALFNKNERKLPELSEGLIK